MTYLHPNASLILKTSTPSVKVVKEILSKRDVSVFLEKTLCKFKHKRCSLYSPTLWLALNKKKRERDEEKESSVLPTNSIM